MPKIFDILSKIIEDIFYLKLSKSMKNPNLNDFQRLKNEIRAKKHFSYINCCNKILKVLGDLYYSIAILKSSYHTSYSNIGKHRHNLSYIFRYNKFLWVKYITVTAAKKHFYF